MNIAEAGTGGEAPYIITDIALWLAGIAFTILSAAYVHLSKRISQVERDMREAIADVERQQEHRNERLWRAIGDMATKADLHREIDRLQDTLREMLRPRNHDTSD